jgi:hypothetical protein
VGTLHRFCNVKVDGMLLEFNLAVGKNCVEFEFIPFVGPIIIYCVCYFILWHN